MTTPKRLHVLLLVSFVAAQAMSAEPQKFIPWSPLNESEAQNLKDKLVRGGVSGVTVDELLKNVDHHHTYREADIFKAYPELRGHQKLSECSNSMMSGATELVFLSSKRQNEVTLETLRCSRAAKGVNCGEVNKETRYFRDGSDRYFLLDGVTLAKAVELLDMYKAGSITGLPDWMSTQQDNISLVKAMPDDSYLLIFGEYLCAGCVFKVQVKIDESGGEKRLVVVGQPEGGCI
jgi:hypothetical protein